MTAPTMVEPLALVGWSETDERWLAARRTGISASDVAAVLGFGPYKTPWEVWADKTGLRTREVDASREAIRLGVALEPWLLRQAAHRLGVDVARTSARLYAHPEHAWRLASPDGRATKGPLIEAKTAGLASGFGVPAGWSDTRAPLGYELQCRWQMHVCGVDQVVLAAMVAGLGMRFYTFDRDLSVEADMVAQVTEWRDRYLVRRVEPAMGPADNALMDATHPAAGAGSVALDDVADLVEVIYEYRDGLNREAAGRAMKEAATARLKRLVGDAAAGTVAGKPVVTWNARIGDVRWRDLVEDLIEIVGWDGPLLDLDELLGQYRKPDSRSISVKGIGS